MMAKCPLKFCRRVFRAPLLLLLLVPLGCQSIPSRTAAATPVPPIVPVVSWTNGELRDGEVTRADLRLPRDLVDSSGSLLVEGRLLGRKFLFYPAGEDRNFYFYSAIVGVNFGTPPGEKPVSITIKRGMPKSELNLPSKLIVVRGQYPEETIGVQPKHVQPSAKEIRRLKKEGSELGRIYRGSSPKRLWDGAFQMPMSSALTSPFGTKRVYNGQMQSFHQGVDFKAAEGTPVFSAAAGKVVLAKDLFLTGNTVIIDHGFEVFTIYAHLSRLHVEPGSMVPKGQLLGLSGMTGRASGPHLHFGARVLGSKVSPLSLIQAIQ